jgi:hypothetical protein
VDHDARGALDDAAADAAANAALRSIRGVGIDDTAVHRVVRVDGPAEEDTVRLGGLLRVGGIGFEMDDGLSRFPVSFRSDTNALPIVG